MKYASSINEKPDPAEIILQAANQRFSEYGYNKTTMAEIAEDAGMSAANIYRYFKNKEEIAAACAKEFMREHADSMKNIIRNKKLNAVQKLESYIFTSLEITQRKAIENKKIDELCTEIARNRSDLVHNKIEDEISMLVEILSYGNQTGEFKIDNVMDAAGSIHAMLVVFDVPLFMHLFSKEEFENKARSVLKIIISGLKHGV